MSFKDSKSREYVCVVSAATAISLKKQFGIDLSGHFDGSLYQKLAEDPELLVNVLAESVKDSMQMHKVDAGEFAESLNGDALDSGVTALQEAITDFSPPRQRAAFRNLMKKTTQALDVATKTLEQRIEELTPESILTSFNSSGSNPESQESSPANSTESPSENSSGSSTESVVTSGIDSQP